MGNFSTAPYQSLLDGKNNILRAETYISHDRRRFFKVKGKDVKNELKG